MKTLQTIVEEITMTMQQLKSLLKIHPISLFPFSVSHIILILNAQRSVPGKIASSS